jgi:hypothetical protein
VRIEFFDRGAGGCQGFEGIVLSAPLLYGMHQLWCKEYLKIARCQWLVSVEFRLVPMWADPDWSSVGEVEVWVAEAAF